MLTKITKGLAGGFCVCAGAQEHPANNWQSVGQRVGFTTSVVHDCTSSHVKMSADGEGHHSQVLNAIPVRASIVPVPQLMRGP